MARAGIPCRALTPRCGDLRTQIGLGNLHRSPNLVADGTDEKSGEPFRTVAKLAGMVARTLKTCPAETVA